jgi:phosphatidylserine/phosphatidylglycerophosphate/cardiolipin synthase-like enzyme
MSEVGGMRDSARGGIALVVMLGLMGWLTVATGHKDPCHQRHSCPSDGGTYECGDRGRCEQCPDNQYCLAGQLRPAASSPAAPAPTAPMPSQPLTPSAVTVCFTPGGNCTDLIVKTLGETKNSILVQAYSFTSAPIAKALLDAHKRGVRVEVILDQSNRTDKYSAADFLANQGVPTKIDANHAISHNKVMVIDGETLITGSFNFTKAAQEKNAENVLIIRDKALAAQYTANWQAHAQHSQPYVGRGVRQ